jgi:UDP-2,3-diacylglucosamine hydrolase
LRIRLSAPRSRMNALFLSDLHLCADRPDINRVFLDFLDGEARDADVMYILGDLFEYWAGDDDIDDPFNASIVSGLSRYARSGPELCVMRGNRDFLLGERFADACEARLIIDPYTIDLFGIQTMLMHGDVLCTDDHDYQAFRSKVRSTAWIKKFLSLPLSQRKFEIEGLRRKSEAEKKRKAPEVMDVSSVAVETILREHHYPRLIHGHTHRPAHHEHRLDGRVCERWVLADWYLAGSYLRCDENGCTPVPLN